MALSCQCLMNESNQCLQLSASMLFLSLPIKLVQLGASAFTAVVSSVVNLVLITAVVFCATYYNRHKCGSCLHNVLEQTFCSSPMAWLLLRSQCYVHAKPIIFYSASYASSTKPLPVPAVVCHPRGTSSATRFWCCE